MPKQRLAFEVNNQPVFLEVDVDAMLLDVLRDQLDLIGAKRGCGEGECGACTVLVDGQPVTSCIYPAMKVNGRRVFTIEGLGDEDNLHPIQQAFLDEGAVQCGFCTPGMILSAKALLDRNPDPTENEIRVFLSGNLCRCTGYSKIVKAVQAAALVLRNK